MSLDEHSGDEDDAPKLAPRAILRHEIKEGTIAIRRSALATVISALSAGLDIGFSVMLMGVMRTKTQGVLSAPVADILIANMYSVGFIFVVLGRSELFTEQTTLAVLPVLDNRASWTDLARLWCLVYFANLAGTFGFAALIASAGPELKTIPPETFGIIARKMTEHGGVAIFVSALYAGWLMGLLSWLVAAGRDTISQLVIVWLVTTAIGFAGLHHVVVGSVEVLTGIFAGQGITFADYGRFLGWTTLGNAVGGSFFVALIKYSHARPDAQS